MKAFREVLEHDATYAFYIRRKKKYTQMNISNCLYIIIVQNESSLDRMGQTIKTMLSELWGSRNLNWKYPNLFIPMYK